VDPVASSQTIKIGLEDMMFDQKHYLDGSIDEVAIYNRALSPSEIQAIYNAGSAGKCKVVGGPVAYAGPDQMVSIGNVATLDGSGTTYEGDRADLTFLWTQIAGPVIPPLAGLVDPTNEIAWFSSATLYTSFPVATFTLRLTVTDLYGRSSWDETMVTFLEDADHAIFVSWLYGDDENLGGADTPVESLSRAFELAASTNPRSDVYVQAGDYYEADSTLTIQDDMSVYGGFSVWAGPKVPFLWARTAINPTRIFGAATAIEVLDIVNPTTIDGLTIEADNGLAGGTSKSVSASYPGRGGSRVATCDEGFFIRRRSYWPATKVWMTQSEPETLPTWDPDLQELIGPQTVRIISQLTYDLYACLPDDPPPDFHDDEIQMNFEPLTLPGPVYSFDILETWSALGCPAILNFYDGPWQFAFIQPGKERVPGYEIVRETLFFFDYEFGDGDVEWRFEQVLRGPDGELYLYRPSPNFFYQGDSYVGIEYPLTDWGHGPILMEPYLQENRYSRVYDLFGMGIPGQDSIAISVYDSNNNLRIANNEISGGWGGTGGDGTDGGDGGYAGEGEYGGKSIGILLTDSSPRIWGNTISTGGGGNGGASASGGDGGDGGDSCGIRLDGTSSISLAYTLNHNTFGIGPAGLGGNPYGEDGVQSEICPPPGVVLELPVNPSLLYVPPGDTCYAFASVPQFMASGSFYSSWGGSDVVMTLVTPSGRIIDRDTVAPDITHVLEAGYEMYHITNPEAGDWTIQLYGADVPETGEAVALSVKGIQDTRAPETTLSIGLPQHIDATGNLYVDSTTPFTLTARDDWCHTCLGIVSGVASTAYRIYNLTYDTGWRTYDTPCHLEGLEDGTYNIDYRSIDNVGNIEAANTATAILDNTPPSTSLTIGEPKYVSGTIVYLTPDTTFTLEATDNPGSGVVSIGYMVHNTTYNSGWRMQHGSPSSFYLDWLTDGDYTIAYTSVDNVGNIEVTNSIQITLFSWSYVFTDSYGRGTTLKINTEHKFFQFIILDRDYGIRNATYMRVYRRTIGIYHKDDELRLITLAVDTKLDFCFAIAWDLETLTQYFLIDKLGIE
jgi:hypothetical protein